MIVLLGFVRVLSRFCPRFCLQKTGTPGLAEIHDPRSDFLKTFVCYQKAPPLHYIISMEHEEEVDVPSDAAFFMRHPPRARQSQGLPCSRPLL